MFSKVSVDFERMHTHTHAFNINTIMANECVCIHFFFLLRHSIHFANSYNPIQTHMNTHAYRHNATQSQQQQHQIKKKPNKKMRTNISQNFAKPKFIHTCTNIYSFDVITILNSEWKVNEIVSL